MNNQMYANYILGEIAWRIAAARPADAERLLTKINAATTRNGLERHLLRACSRMAPRDLERARKLAASLGPLPQPNNNGAGLSGQPPQRKNHSNRNRSGNSAGPGLWLYAQLVVAKAIADSKPAAARAGRGSHCRAAPRAIEEPSGPGEPSPACLIAGCLPLVEQLMPERVAEYLWLALACRAPRGDEPDLEQLRVLANLAGIVARYDRAAAAQIAGPVFDQVPVPSRAAFPANKWVGFEQVFQGLACLDPRRASNLVGRLPEDEKLSETPEEQLQGAIAKKALGRVRVNGAGQYAIRSASRIQLAEALLLPIDRRRLEVLNAIANPWLLDPAAEVPQ